MSDLFCDKSAEFSPCRDYRYSLWRWWDKSKGYALFIGLNPSTADETNDDPTVRRCINFAKKWGYGGLCMANLFAVRSPYPWFIKCAHNPVGPENNKHLEKVAKDADVVIAAWGNDGSYMDRDDEVKKLFPNMMCLKKNKNGSPGHPLYLHGDSRLKSFVAPFNYEKEIEATMTQWRKNEITKAGALKILESIELSAYALIPDAEPDGDITYCVAMAVEGLEV